MVSAPDTANQEQTYQVRSSERQARALQIIETLKKHLPAILRDRPVMMAYAYGSMAEGCPLPFSDVDVALVLRRDAGLSAYQRFSLESDIAAELERACGIQDADVRSVDHAPLRVQGHVLTRGLLLYSRDEDFRVAYQVRTLKRYFDFQPTLTMMRQAYFARMEADLRKKGLYGRTDDH
jgi:predicted nucleotidyltransferase